jgi:Trk K+ transport system NAD-binding subunit
MKILIVGAGAVGFHLAEHLSEEGHDIVLIDQDKQRAASAQELLDIMTIVGNGASLAVLEQAGVADIDLLAAVTNVDEVNLVACMSAGPYSIKTKVARVSNRLEPRLFRRNVPAPRRAAGRRQDDQPGDGVRLGDLPATAVGGGQRVGFLRRRPRTAARPHSARGFAGRR